jgi:hypothetical protein
MRDRKAFGFGWGQGGFAILGKSLNEAPTCVETWEGGVLTDWEDKIRKSSGDEW